ncbi:hypothetical protein [Domibacillus epiphyticus]|uniref:Uncharacterized protein n=1 Tax=Domibacillus epiphyticus TaxID=1714355 RepID=A0A1V2A3Y2_9BACI|nr:hypothetical protein [Domibacillus epiphyticus]OMP65691.1 hypothetical protein BTO28_16180 [Domibacillus epiphyticus]
MPKHTFRPIQQVRRRQQTPLFPPRVRNEEFGSLSNLEAIMQPGFAGTDPAEVQKEIASDLARGDGDITSREAGGYRFRRL